MAEGDTETLPAAPVTVPGAGEMLSDVLPVTDHDSIVLCPELMLAGDAVKDEITGTAAVGVVTETAAHWAEVFPAAS